jgi:hypothetical protein
MVIIVSIWFLIQGDGSSLSSTVAPTYSASEQLHDADGEVDVSWSSSSNFMISESFLMWSPD